jgi:hypothetical protein
MSISPGDTARSVRLGRVLSLLTWPQFEGLVLGLFPIFGLALSIAGIRAAPIVWSLWLLLVPLYVVQVAVARADRVAVVATVLTAMLLRVVIGATVFALIPSIVLRVFDDTARYLEIGSAMASAWQTGAGVDLFNAYALSVAGYYYVVAALLYLTADGPLVVIVFNAAIAGLTVVLLNQLALDLGIDRKARLLGLAIAGFMPSVVFWGSIPLKDSLVSLLVILGVVAALRLGGTHRFVALGVLCASIALVSSLRLYATVFLGLACLMVIGLSGMWRRRRAWSAFVVAAVAVVALYSFQGPVGSLVFSAATNPAEIERQQELYDRGGSAPGESVRAIGLGGIILRQPLYIARYFVLPLPFATGGSLVALALPEMLIWYPLLVAGVIGLWRLRQQRPLEAIVLGLVVFAMASVYGTIVSNAGSLIRYRAQGILLLALPIAVGCTWIWNRLAQRRAAG